MNKEQTESVLDHNDVIENSITQAHALCVCLQAAVEHESPPSKDNLANSLWAIVQILSNAEKSKERLLEIKRGHKRGEK